MNIELDKRKDRIAALGQSVLGLGFSRPELLWYDDRVMIRVRKFFALLLIVIVLFIVATISVLMLVPFAEESGKSLLTAALICGGIVAVLSLAVLMLITFRYATPKEYQAFVLQEINLDEAEINQAIDNWAYARHQVRMEDKATFLEDEDGAVSCRIKVRKD